MTQPELQLIIGRTRIRCYLPTTTHPVSSILDEWQLANPKKKKKRERERQPHKNKCIHFPFINFDFLNFFASLNPWISLDPNVCNICWVWDILPLPIGIQLPLSLSFFLRFSCLNYFLLESFVCNILLFFRNHLLVLKWVTKFCK